MLKKIELENYRCFEKTKMCLRDLVILVGKNNAGKSCFVEALRMVAMASKKCTSTNYEIPPKILGLPLSMKGFRLPVERLKIDLRGIVYCYKEEVAKIIATFENEIKIIIYVNQYVAFAVILGRNNVPIIRKSEAKEVGIPFIGILPQIELIKEREKKLNEDTVINDMDTYLSSRHFRNELYLFKQFYYEFKQLAENTWPGLRIREIDYDSSDNELFFFIEDARFTAEIGHMGSGIQMWLQIIWFICRSKQCNTIILDEPDVYMHPDLQLKILKIVKSMFKQVIIATHSVEIISNVSPKNIIAIDKKSRQMKYANEIREVQYIINDIGSTYNLSLIKLGNANKCIFVEGEDMKILQQFFNILHPNELLSLDNIPFLPLGGFTKINEAFGAAKLFYDSSKGHFKCYAILDRDYYTEKQIEEQKRKAYENHLILHIWEKKEIENYLIKPRVIYRLLKNNISYSDFIYSLETLIDSFKDNVIDSYTTKISEENRNLAAGTAARQAREYVNSKWIDLDNKINIVSGKDVLREINKWLKTNYNINCSMNSIFNVMTPQDIDDEIVQVLNNLVYD